MNSDQLKDHSKKIRKQAAELLKSTDIQAILEKYGAVHLMGSYPMDIMYDPDIDLVVETQSTKESSMNALRDIIDRNLVRKVEYGDFVHFPVKNRPHGYIIVLQAEVDGTKWEIEVWFLNDVAEQLEYKDTIESKLTEEKRLEVLKAKHARETSNKNKHELSSYKIYELVLE